MVAHTIFLNDVPFVQAQLQLLLIDSYAMPETSLTLLQTPSTTLNHVVTTTTSVIAQDQSAFSCMPVRDAVGPTLNVLAPPHLWGIQLPLPET